MAPYETLPDTAKSTPTKFELHVSDQELSDFKQLIRLSPITQETYENRQQEVDFKSYGITRAWMLEAKEYWQNKFDWRAHEAHINSFPNYKLKIRDDDGREFDIHFVALFSEKRDAVPLALFHGWPGSFLEFLPILDLLRRKYTPQDLPYHIVVPSLPGYTLSSPPPVDKDWDTFDSARLMHKLLVALGFEAGYVAQGGDIGSYISRILGAHYVSCRAVHLNFSMMRKPDNAPPDSELSAAEAKFLPRGGEFVKLGHAYVAMQGTKPATIGMCLSASPIALLAWIAEKFLAWSDQDPSFDQILESVSLYWLTRCFPTSIYTYRFPYQHEPLVGGFHGAKSQRVLKPLGYSFFPYEVAPMPKSWVAETGNLVWHREHENGGHFAALEKPEELLADVEDFVASVWNKDSAKV
ncbi:alpha/beta-hydrolase [Patellaria atrata CBS 101060]|uniref:Alpha/beta-hydrolase n=1 Tax=Patellaria atrata CBS 101060 TaxID=1346257 RepID=A0A9P4VP38_9PEZI|nr:alpha/beta-hydrolase [Patellaria atrata CBS 101060]